MLLFTCSGTGAMESAVANLCSPGDRVVVVSAGAFGERWHSSPPRSAARSSRSRTSGARRRAPTTSPRLDELGGAKAVFLTHSETSTGVVADLQALAAAAKSTGTLVVADAVSSLGAVPLETDAWGVDVVVLRLAEGADDAARPRARHGRGGRAGRALGSSPRFYFDWEKTRAGQEKLDSAFTPAVSLVRALNVALGLLLEEGLEAAFDRHVRLGRACREGAKAMGLELFSPDEDRSAVVTAMRVPEGIDASEFSLTLRDRYGVTIAGGQGDLKGKIFRIGHIGYYDVFDIATALGAVELALADAGADIERGVAVTRALEAFAAPAPV